MRSVFIAKILTVSLSLLSVTTIAASLKVADNLDIKEVNDQVFNQGFFANKKTLELMAGKNSIVLKYKDVFEDEDLGQDRVVESDYFVVQFTLTDQQQLRLKTTKVKNLSQAEAYASAPEVILVDKNQHQLPLTLDSFENYQLARQVNKALTSLPESKRDTALIKKSQSMAIEDNQETADIAANENNARMLQEQQNIANQEFNEKLLGSVDSLPMLKYWWQKASAKEKQNFVKYINSQ